jgi:hypothetical protein
MKKIMLSFILGILVLGFAMASISGMAVSVSEGEKQAFSFNEKDYSVEVSESNGRTAELKINGERIENVKEGDSLIVDGAEVVVKRVKAHWLFRKQYKVDLEVREGIVGKIAGSSGGEVSHGMINAHACNADGICEMDRLYLESKELNLSSKWKLFGNSAIGSNYLNFYDVNHGWTPLELISHQNQSGLILHGTLDANKVVVNGDVTLNGDGELKLQSNAGNGSAYACFTSEGVLYRSQTPCTFEDNFFEIKNSNECLSAVGGNSSVCDSCNEICDVFSKENCADAYRGKYEGNTTYIPSYFEAMNCDEVTSNIQFKLYCNCYN